MKTYVDHPVLGRVRIRTAHVKSIAVSHRLYYSYMISAIEMLEREKSEEKLNSVMRRALTMRESLQTRYVVDTSSIRSFGLFGREAKDRVACATESSRSITSCAYFAANRCTGNELALSSRREYLRGPYTSTTTRTRCIRMKL